MMCISQASSRRGRKKSQAHIMLHVREITTQQPIKDSYSEREGHEKLQEVLITACLSGGG